MIVAAVPVKRLDRAKGRLAHVLTPSQRRRLALAMLEDVVRALQAVSRIDQIVVVSADHRVLARARELAARCLSEPPSSRDVNDALAHASASLQAAGAQTLLVLAADVPTADPAHIEALLDALPERGVALAPSHDGGTAALALRPPDAVPFCYGPNSAARHQRQALARGLIATSLPLDSLARDIDGPDDLDWLLSHPPGPATVGALDGLTLARARLA